jgi:predicted dehydrogenase
MPVKTYQVGVVGYGWAAGAHIDAINGTGLGRVTAICSSRQLDAKAVSAKHGGEIRCYHQLEEMLRNPDLDVVSICSFPNAHARQAIAGARAGKHLIIEKPLALSWKECCAVRDAVAKAGVRTCVCFECRYSSQFLTIKSVLDSNLLGDVHYAEVDYYHGIGPWYGQFRWNIRRDTGGSSLLSAGCHALDALLLCLGTDVTSVSSYACGSRNKDFAAYEYPSTSVTILKFKEGQVGKCTSSIDCLQPYYFHTHLVGSEGSLLDNKFHSTKLQGLNKQRWSELAMKLLDSGDVSDHPYQSQFAAFFQALARGEPMPLTSLDDALKTHEILFAADRSATLGKAVHLG